MEPFPKRAFFPPKSLSDVPVDVIDGILSCLPIADAVRTSALSRWWCRRWRSIPDLVFDFRHIETDVVDHVLRLYSGPIRSLSLLFFLPFDPSSDVHVAHWLSSLSAADPDPVLKSLTIQFNRYQSTVDETLFAFRNLTHLDIRGCYLPCCSGFPGFPVLETLVLEGCYFEDNSAPELISNCPVLRRLKLVEVDGCEILPICAPSLRSILFEGVFEEFVFVDAPVLNTVSICVSSINDDDDDEEDDEEEGRCNLIEAFGNVRSIEKLELFDYSLHFLGKFGIPLRVADSFERLKVLTLAVDFNYVEEMLATFCLLRSSPNLQQLEIIAPTYNRNSSGTRRWKQHGGDLDLPKLKRLTMRHVTVAGTELEFIDFFLPKVRELEKLEVNVARTESKKQRRNLESKFKELVEHWRASTRAEIILAGIEKSKTTQTSSTSNEADANRTGTTSSTSNESDNDTEETSATSSTGNEDNTEGTDATSSMANKADTGGIDKTSSTSNGTDTEVTGIKED